MNYKFGQLKIIFIFSHFVLGASSIYRLARRVHQLHMLDLEHILLAVEGEGARAERPEENPH